MKVCQQICRLSRCNASTSEEGCGDGASEEVQGDSTEGGKQDKEVKPSKVSIGSRKVWRRFAFRAQTWLGAVGF